MPDRVRQVSPDKGIDSASRVTVEPRSSSDLLVSVLIPVYNWDISALFERLAREVAASCLGRAEILAIDDGSTDEATRLANQRCVQGLSLGWVRLYENEKNAGRSAVRNLLARRARGSYLLFLDSDVLPDADGFLGRYLAYAESNQYDVVCGGLSYRIREKHGKEYDFHAYHGARTEAKPASMRNADPWRLILTSNVMVRSPVFLDTPFSEDFTGYGYEDVEWGIRLSASYRVLHIDNTVSHLGLASKEVFYRKMRESIKNYALLRKLHPGHFAMTRISTYVRVLAYAPEILLDSIDKLLSHMFAGTKQLRLLHLIYQLDKAVLLARESKSQ
jgi:GT2 family glycosyltransferase